MHCPPFFEIIYILFYDLGVDHNFYNCNNYNVKLVDDKLYILNHHHKYIIIQFKIFTDKPPQNKKPLIK